MRLFLNCLKGQRHSFKQFGCRKNLRFFSFRNDVMHPSKKVDPFDILKETDAPPISPPLPDKDSIFPKDSYYSSIFSSVAEADSFGEVVWYKKICYILKCAMENFHDVLGVEWIVAIPFIALSYRILIFPILVKQFKLLRFYQLNQKKLITFKKILQKILFEKNYEKYKSALFEYKKQKRNSKIFVYKQFLYSASLIPLFLSGFWSVVAVSKSSATTFNNIEYPIIGYLGSVDHSLILPLCYCACIFFNVYRILTIYPDKYSLISRYIKTKEKAFYISICLPIVFLLLFSYNMFSGLILYLISNSIFSIITNELMKTDKIKFRGVPTLTQIAINNVAMGKIPEIEFEKILLKNIINENEKNKSPKFLIKKLKEKREKRKKYDN